MGINQEIDQQEPSSIIDNIGIGKEVMGRAVDNRNSGKKSSQKCFGRWSDKGQIT